jgi:hypothetical protein
MKVLFIGLVKGSWKLYIEHTIMALLRLLMF